MAKRILTLDIGASSVVLAEYSAGAGGYLTLVAYGRTALPAPVDAANAEALLVPAIEGIASANGIRPGKVAVSVSSQTVFSRLAEIPARPGSVSQWLENVFSAGPRSLCLAPAPSVAYTPLP